MKRPSQHSAAAEHEQRERKRVTAGGGGGGSRRIEGGSEEEGGSGGEIQIQEGRQGCSSSSPVARATMVMSPAARLSAAMRSPTTPIALVNTPNEKLYEFLNIQLESDLNLKRMRHDEVVYLILAERSAKHLAAIKSPETILATCNVL